MDSPDSALSQWRLKVLHKGSFSLIVSDLSESFKDRSIHITCLTHTLLTHKGSPVLIISTISTELACHIMALTTKIYNSTFYFSFSLFHSQQVII